MASWFALVAHLLRTIETPIVGAYQPLNILTIQDVRPYNLNITVSVRSALLVPEPNWMSDLVHHHVSEITVATDRDLSLVTMVAHVTPTAT